MRVARGIRSSSSTSGPGASVMPPSPVLGGRDFSFGLTLVLLGVEKILILLVLLLGRD